jgi:hypothetical protein
MFRLTFSAIFCVMSIMNPSVHTHLNTFSTSHILHRDNRCSYRFDELAQEIKNINDAVGRTLSG